jgi:hypothetical protein
MLPLCFIAGLAHAAEPCVDRSGPSVTSPDGKVTVFVSRDASRTDDSALGEVAHEDLCLTRDGKAPALLLAGRAGTPESGLTGFESLLLSGELLFFTAGGWVTSPAAHRVDLRTGAEKFLFDGAVLARTADGHFVATHFRRDTEYPVSSPKYRGRMESWSLVTRDGAVVRALSEATANRLSLK